MMRARARRAPPLWILLDVLMVWVLALLSMPMEEVGATYEFLGIPPGSLVFKVALPLRPDQSTWTLYDFDNEHWREQTRMSPVGRSNYLCDECVVYLSSSVDRDSHILLSLPKATAADINGIFVRACNNGDCSPKLRINGEGNVQVARRN